MKKNASGQSVGAQLVSASDGSAFTGSVTVYVTGDAGTQAVGSVGSGACTHEGNGYHTYAPAQAETNHDLVAFTFTGTGAVPVTVQVYTAFPQTGDSFARIGTTGSGLTSLASQASVDTIDGIVDSILLDTAEIGAAGAGLTEAGGTGDQFSAIPWNAAWDTEVQSECTDALNAYDGPTNTEMVAAFTEIKGVTWATTDTLEAIRDRGDAAWTTGAGGTPPDLLQSTTIATLASQTSFTLTAGSADNDAYNGAIAIVTDSATSTQKAVGSVSDYTGSTKTVTLAADPGIFTMAVGDTIEIVAATGTGPTAAAIRAEIDSNSTQLAAIVADTNELQSDDYPTTLATLATAAELAKVPKSDGTTSWNATALAAINAEADTAISDASLATAANLATVDTVVDGIQTDLSNATDGLGALKTLIDAAQSDITTILADTGELQTDWANGGRLDTILDTAAAGGGASAASIADAVWDEILSGHVVSGSAGEALAAAGTAGDPWITALPGAYGSGTAGYIVGTNLDAPVSTVDTVVDAIKVKTDLIGSGSATISSPVAPTGTINSPLIIGDDYLASQSRALEWTIDDPGFTAGTSTCKLGFSHPAAGSFEVSGTITDNGSTWTLSFDISASDSSGLSEGKFDWSVHVADTSSKKATKVRSSTTSTKVDWVNSQTTV